MNKVAAAYSQPLPGKPTPGGEELSWAEKHAPASALPKEEAVGGGMPPELQAATDDAAGVRSEMQANQQQSEMQMQQQQQQAESAASKAEMDAQMATKQTEMAAQVAEKEAEMKAQQAQLQADTEVAKRDAQISNLESQLAQAGATASTGQSDADANQTASRKTTVSKLNSITSKLDNIGSARVNIGLPKVARLLDACTNTAHRGWVKQASLTPQGYDAIQQTRRDSPELNQSFNAMGPALPKPQAQQPMYSPEITQAGRDSIQTTRDNSPWGKSFAQQDMENSTPYQGGMEAVNAMWEQGPNRYYDQAYSSPESQGGFVNGLRDMTLGAGSNTTGGLMDWGRGVAALDWRQAGGGLWDTAKGIVGSSGAYDNPGPPAELTSAPQAEGPDMFGNLRNIFSGVRSMASGTMTPYGYRDTMGGIRGLKDIING